jgi:hypothetical protein
MSPERIRDNLKKEKKNAQVYFLKVFYVMEKKQNFWSPLDSIKFP